MMKRMRNILLYGSVAWIAAIAAAAPWSAAALSRAATVYGYDYSDPAYAFRSTVTEADIVSAYAGGISQAEYDYLSAHGEIELGYRDAVDISSISTNFSEEDDLLSVTPSAYSYRSAAGTTVTWTPVSVNGEPLTDGTYRTQLSALGEDYVTVQYQTGFPIARVDLNAALDRSLAAGRTASAEVATKRAAHEEALTAYHAAQQRYAQYERDLETYENVLLPAYRQYLSDLAAWNRYRDYLAKLSEYNAKKTRHEEWEKKYGEWYEAARKWSSYSAEYAEYERKMEEYNRKLDSPEAQKAVRQISYLDFMFEPTPCAGQSRTLFNAVTGSTVDSVIAERNTITEFYPNLGHNLDKAAAATQTLRQLFYTYRYDIVETGGGYDRKYAFYIMNYDKVAHEVTELLHALNSLFRSSADIKSFIAKQGKLEQFRILVAELYVMANLLTDGRIPNYENYVFDKNYKFDGSAPSQILVETDIPEDIDDAAPVLSGVPFPAGQPVEPVKPADPGPAPAEPPLPGDPPASVPAVKEPAPVAMPQQPEEPPLPVEPAPPAISAEEAALAEAYDGGALDHARAQSDFTFPCTTEVIRYFRNARTVVVRFYADEAGEGEPVYTATVLYDGGVVYPYDAPVKTRTGYRCTFRGWVDGKGNPVDLAHIRTDLGTLTLYPSFDETPESYRVIWMVNGKPVEGACDYGSVPEYAFGEPSRSTETFAYRFLGWSQRGVLLDELPTVTERDMTFVAEFEESARVVWTVPGSPAVVTYPFAGEEIAYPGTPARANTEKSRFLFKGWSQNGALVPSFPSPQPATRYAYSAVFEEIRFFSCGMRDGAVTREGSAYLVDASAHSSAAGTWSFSALMQELSSVENATLEVRFSGITLYFSEALLEELSDKNVGTMSANVYAKDGSCRLFVHLFGTDGGEIFPQTRMEFAADVSSFSFPFELSSVDLQNIAEEGDVQTLSADGGMLRAKVGVGAVYEICKRYSVAVMEDERVEIVAGGRYEAGEEVPVTFRIVAPGISATLYYSYPAEDGSLCRVPVEGGSFGMPAHDVRLDAEIVYLEYTAVFVADGRTLYQRTFRYGDKLEAPPFDPVKSGDGQYTYTFSHWEDAEGNRLSSSTLVTGDATYTAVFVSEPIPPAPETGMTKLETILLAAKIVIPCVLALLLALIVFLIVRRVRRRRAALTASGGAEAVSGETEPAEGETEAAADTDADPQPASGDDAPSSPTEEEQTTDSDGNGADES